MSILSDQRALANGNLPAGVTERDISGGDNQFPSLRRYLDGDAAGRISVEMFLANFQSIFSKEIIDELSTLVGSSDKKKIDCVNWILSELQASHERHNG